MPLGKKKTKHVFFSGKLEQDKDKGAGSVKSETSS